MCVVKVDQAEPDRDLLPAWTWPRTLIGGGFPLISSSPGPREHRQRRHPGHRRAHDVYALTSRHVRGPAGHPVSTLLAGGRSEIGRSDGMQLVARAVHRGLPEYPGRRTFLTLDAGLVEVGDVEDWSSQTYGLPPSASSPISASATSGPA